jgi:hypothetical protein
VSFLKLFFGSDDAFDSKLVQVDDAICDLRAIEAECKRHLSLTPGFRRVLERQQRQSRFNGFPAAKTV